MRPPRSLRARLLLGTTLSLAAILAAASVTLYALMRASLVHEFDDALLAEARAITRLTELDTGRVEVELEPAAAPPTRAGEDPHQFEMWSDDGEVIARSAVAAPALRPLGVRPGEVPRFERIPLEDGRPGRVVLLRFEPRDEGGNDAAPPLRRLNLAVARDTAHLDATLARLRMLLVAVSAAAVVAGTGVVAWVIGRGLRPLHALAGAIARVGVNDLSERIEPRDTPREVEPVVQRLNELLARLEGVVGRERSFTADVAHELRTPLSGLSSLLEVCASRPRDAEAYRDVVRRALRVTGGMQSMVNNLLTLARADCDQLAPTAEPLELAPLLRECWEPYDAEARRRGLRVDFDLDPGAVVQADRDLLRMIINNLSANAVTYADEGGTITVRADDGANDKVTLTVSNSGSRLSAGQAAHVFDRFWRGDAARSDAGDRCGLGLSLCRRLADVLGGSISATSVDGAFTVTLTLPSPPLTPPASGPSRPALRSRAR
jgi:heavy metal sensor kinase